MDRKCERIINFFNPVIEASIQCTCIIKLHVYVKCTSTNQYYFNLLFCLVVNYYPVLCLTHLQIALPADAKRKNTKMYEEVVVPPNTHLPPKEGETPIPISSLDEVRIS